MDSKLPKIVADDRVPPGEVWLVEEIPIRRLIDESERIRDEIARLTAVPVHLLGGDPTPGRAVAQLRESERSFGRIVGKITGIRP